jgi:branched-chain amino acid transport system ATP-binding protein
MVRTFQLVSVFNSLTVWENLVLSSIRFHQESLSEWGFLFSPANRENIRKNCFKAMKGVGLGKNWQTMTSELSYGSKRMLEIGIALSLRPKLLLLDEPLSGLSDLEIVEVLEILRRIKKDLTLIIIEHKLSKIVNLVERLCVMNEGVFICEGAPDRVLSDRAVRECYWGKGEVTLS